MNRRQMKIDIYNLPDVKYISANKSLPTVEILKRKPANHLLR